MILSRSLEAALDAEAGPACALDLDGAIVFLNRAWDSHVVPPGDVRSSLRWLIGKRWTDSFSPEPAVFYGNLFKSALALAPDSDSALMHISECNTPELVRRSITWLAPVHQDHRVVGVAIVHGLQDIGTSSAVYGLSRAPVASYRADDESLAQCSSCRRLKHPGTGQWDFVAAALAQLQPNQRAVVCDTCRELYRVPPTQVPSRWKA